MSLASSVSKKIDQLVLKLCQLLLKLCILFDDCTVHLVLHLVQLCSQLFIAERQHLNSKNCRILSELGTSRHEIMRSVLVQQAIFFVFPLVMGVAHSLVALQVVIEIVALFGGMSIGGTVGMTCSIFLLCYGGYFLVTYLMSKGIVSDAIRVRHAH